MWNSGSDVIIRSSAVSSIHQGNPSPAITYARCVCVTSFERPVVPDVGISTTGSSSPAGPVPSTPADRSANSPASGIDAAPGTPPSAGTSSSVTTTRGSTCAASPASSASLLRGLAVTTMAPM